MSLTVLHIQNIWKCSIPCPVGHEQAKNFLEIGYNVIEAVPTLCMFHLYICVIVGYAELINVLK